MPKITLVVTLYINPGREAEFERFESAAARIMRRYGGSIVRRIGCAQDGADQPHEVHIVSFPDEDSLEHYRKDPDLVTLADLRALAIRQTTVVRGVDLKPFEK